MSDLKTMPKDHVSYLKRLKESGFEPKVIYDIGSCVALDKGSERVVAGY